MLILVKLLNSPRYFPDDTSLSYGIMLINATVRLFNEFEDVLELCGIPSDWRMLISQKEVLGVPTRFIKMPGKLLSLMRRLSGTSSPYISAVGKDGTKTVISDS